MPNKLADVDVNEHSQCSAGMNTDIFQQNPTSDLYKNLWIIFDSIDGESFVVAPKGSSDPCYQLSFKNIFIAHTPDGDDSAHLVSVVFLFNLCYIK